MALTALALHWNQIWTVMEAWDRRSTVTAVRERLLAAAPPPKRAKMTANLVTASKAAAPDTFDFRETTSPGPMVLHAARSPRIFSFRKLRAHTGAAAEAPAGGCLEGGLGDDDMPEGGSERYRSLVAGEDARGAMCRSTSASVGSLVSPTTTGADRPSIAGRSPRIFTYSKLRTDTATKAPGSTGPVRKRDAATAFSFTSAPTQPSSPHGSGPSPRIYAFSKLRADAATEAPSSTSPLRKRDAATAFSFTSAPTQASIPHEGGPSPRIYAFGAQPRTTAPPASAAPFKFCATATLAPVPGPVFAFSVAPPKVGARVTGRSRPADWPPGLTELTR